MEIAVGDKERHCRAIFSALATHSPRAALFLLRCWEQPTAPLFIHTLHRTNRLHTRLLLLLFQATISSSSRSSNQPEVGAAASIVGGWTPRNAHGTTPHSILRSEHPFQFPPLGHLPTLHATQHSPKMGGGGRVRHHSALYGEYGLVYHKPKRVLQLSLANELYHDVRATANDWRILRAGADTTTHTTGLLEEFLSFASLRRRVGHEPNPGASWTRMLPIAAKCRCH